MNKKQLKTHIRNLLKEELSKINEFDPLSPKKKGRRYVPETIVFPKDIRMKFKGHFKLFKSASGEAKLYISTAAKQALESMRRGRGSVRDMSELAKELMDLPSPLKSVLKKYSPKINSGLKMYPVQSVIKDVVNGDIHFWNPSGPDTKDKAIDNTLGEKELDEKYGKDYLKELYSSLNNLFESIPSPVASFNDDDIDKIAKITGVNSGDPIFQGAINKIRIPRRIYKDIDGNKDMLKVVGQLKKLGYTVNDDYDKSQLTIKKKGGYNSLGKKDGVVVGKNPPPRG